MSQAGVVNVIENNPSIPTEFDGNSGYAVPLANKLQIVGTGSVSTSGSGNTITISNSSSATWSTISASQTLVVGNGYFCVSPGGALSLALPAVSSVGNMIRVVLDGSTSFTITQSAGQQIRVGNLATTAGVGGSLTSTQQGDSIHLVCRTANLYWVVVSSMGNFTVV